MSRPVQTLRVLEALSPKEVGHLYRKGVELSLEDSRTYREGCVQWTLLAIDLGYLTLESNKRTIGRIYSDMISRDIYEVLSSFDSLVTSVRTRNQDGFKSLCRGISPHLYNVVKTSFEGVINSDVIEARRLIQLFSYLGRLSLRDIDLSDQCINDYLDSERKISNHTLNRDLIKNIKPLIESYVRDFDPSNLRFSHGPGGVAGHGRTTLYNKYRDLSRDRLVNLVFGHQYYTGNQLPLSSLDRISSTIFVPKSYKTFRTISMEPTTLMYLQQGLWKELDRMIKANSWLRARVDVSDQVRNQVLAKEGSILRNLATIDLSAASDSVSWELVRSLFKDTSLYPYLVATRSRKTVLPNGDLIRLKKFAPMGSALCFPIETLVFLAITHHSVNKTTRLKGSLASQTFSVYGDDIILPTEAVPELLWELDQLGFTVNQSKSFFREDQWFRESCGAEYCDGFDVTPMRVSRKYASKMDGVSVSGLVDMSNAAYHKGFMNLRAYFIHKLRRFKFRFKKKEYAYTPYFSPGHLQAESYTNFHTRKYFDYRLWAYRVYHTGIRDEKVKGDNEIALRHWLEVNEDREIVLEPFISKVGSHSVRFTNTSSISYT